MSRPGLYTAECPTASWLRNVPRYKPSLPHGQPVCVSASNVTTTATLLRLATAMGPYIAVLQVHSDNIVDWSVLSTQRLSNVAEKFGFMIWENGRVLNTQGRSGRAEPLSEDQITRSIDIARKRYTKGLVGIASWAGITSTWGISSKDHRESAARLIPELRDAARDGVMSSAMSVQTEITVGDAPPDTDNDVVQQVTVEETTDDHDDGGENIPGPLGDDSEMALNLRGLSSISLTQTISQYTEDSSSLPAEKFGSEPTAQEYDDFVFDENTASDSSGPPPPLLSRGVVVCLPTEYEVTADPTYQESVFADCLKHGDFIIGFVTDESWGSLFYRERHKPHTWVEEDDPEEDLSSWEPGGTRAIITFLPLEHDIGSEAGNAKRKPSTNLPTRMRSLSISSDSTQSSQKQHPPSPASSYSHQINMLHDLVGRAVAVRSASILTKGIVSRKEATDVIWIPIISMNV